MFESFYDQIYNSMRIKSIVFDILARVIKKIIKTNKNVDMTESTTLPLWLVDFTQPIWTSNDIWDVALNYANYPNFMGDI